MPALSKLWRNAMSSRVQLAWLQGFFAGAFLVAVARLLGGTD